jgi:hypothetical protein
MFSGLALVAVLSTLSFSATTNTKTEVVKVVKQDTVKQVKYDTLRTLKYDTLRTIKVDTIKTVKIDTVKVVKPDTLTITRTVKDTSIVLKADTATSNSKGHGKKR